MFARYVQWDVVGGDPPVLVLGASAVLFATLVGFSLYFSEPDRPRAAVQSAIAGTLAASVYVALMIVLLTKAFGS